MKLVGRESTKLSTKTPKTVITSLLSQNCVFPRKWGFDKMKRFGGNPYSLERTEFPFYREGTVIPVFFLDKYKFKKIFFRYLSPEF